MNEDDDQPASSGLAIFVAVSAAITWFHWLHIALRILFH